MSTGESTGTSDLQLFVQRGADPKNGLEECYFTFCYSPIRNDAGEIEGVFCACSETTQQVVGHRRLKTLRSLDSITTPIKTISEACRLTLNTLRENPHDVPFALLYLLEGDLARLVNTAGIKPDTTASPIIVDLTQPEAQQGNGWEFAQVREHSQKTARKMVVNNFV